MGIFSKRFGKRPERSTGQGSNTGRGDPIVVPFLPPTTAKGNHQGLDLRERIERVLDEIRPYLHGDGGDVELMNVTEDGTVEMHFVGACHGCPSSAITLKLGIESSLKERIPEITEVVMV
jgi:Fe-S cluster biogenesis protein NfuA